MLKIETTKLKIVTGVFCLIGMLAVGCTPDKEESVKENPADKVDSHAGHDHSQHVHGKHDGELFEVAGMTGEWVGKYGQNLVQFYFYEKGTETETPVKAEKLVASFKAGEVKTVDVPAVDAGDNGATRFEVVDEDLAMAMKNTGINLELEIDGEKHTVKLAKDPHAP